MVVSNIFYFHPYLGKIPNLTNIFQMGWFNHQLGVYVCILGVSNVYNPLDVSLQNVFFFFPVSRAGFQKICCPTNEYRVLKGPGVSKGRGCSWGTLRIPFGKIGEP